MQGKTQAGLIPSSCVAMIGVSAVSCPLSLPTHVYTVGCALYLSPPQYAVCRHAARHTGTLVRVSLHTVWRVPQRPDVHNDSLLLLLLACWPPAASYTINP